MNEWFLTSIEFKLYELNNEYEQLTCFVNH